jgi:hypothetical protein
MFGEVDDTRVEVQAARRALGPSRLHGTAELPSLTLSSSRRMKKKRGDAMPGPLRCAQQGDDQQGFRSYMGSVSW